jgi:hypothetical protein
VMGVVGWDLRRSVVVCRGGGGGGGGLVVVRAARRGIYWGGEGCRGRVCERAGSPAGAGSCRWWGGVATVHWDPVLVWLEWTGRGRVCVT